MFALQIGYNFDVYFNFEGTLFFPSSFFFIIVSSSLLLFRFAFPQRKKDDGKFELMALLPISNRLSARLQNALSLPSHWRSEDSHARDVVTS